MDNIKKTWKEAKGATGQPSGTVETLILKARQKKKSVLYFHYGNIVVLTITLVAIALFFYKVVHFQTNLGKAGIVLMHSGLIIRILVEVYSSIKSKKIVLLNDAAQTNSDALSFYNFRRAVHGPITIATVGLYMAGFYFLSPEFAMYLNLTTMILMHLSFVVGAIFVVWQVRKGVQTEMRNLRSLRELKDQLEETE